MVEVEVRDDHQIDQACEVALRGDVPEVGEAPVVVVPAGRRHGLVLALEGECGGGSWGWEGGEGTLGACRSQA